jgi:hypothetical protein
MTRVAAIAAAALVLAGCGGSTAPPPVAKPPRIPRALAQSWAAQANDVAQALQAGDGCTAVRYATELRASIAQSELQVPRRLRAMLVSTVNALPGRITRNPAPPPVNPHPHPHPPHHPPDHHGHGHDRGPGGGDQG